MGNEDGFMSAMGSIGTNTTIERKDYMFSFASGNEIALCHGGQYFILNCGQKLWDEVTEFMAKNPTYKEAKKWWVIKKKDYEESSWSNDF